MKTEYAIVATFIGAVYALVKVLLPDFNFNEEVFQIVFFGVLALLGVEVVGKPADKLRSLVANKFKSKKK